MVLGRGFFQRVDTELDVFFRLRFYAHGFLHSVLGTGFFGSCVHTVFCRLLASGMDVEKHFIMLVIIFMICGKFFHWWGLGCLGMLRAGVFRV